MRGQNGLLGILRVPIEQAKEMSQAQMKMLMSIKETTCLAMDRMCSVRQQMRDKGIIEKEKERTILLRSISHDLRTPLAGIMGLAEILMDMAEEGRTQKQLIEDIYQDAEWLYQLVENILSLTRLRDGILIHKELEACEEVVDAAVQKMQRRAEGRRIQVFVPGECLVLPIDAKLIEQVLLNLLDNAIKFTNEEDEIQISVFREDGEAVFEVKDSGEGISQEDLPYIFQLFYTKSKENNGKKKGTGMGLVICESIVKAHGGSISAGNRKDGTGAVLRFTLPL